MDADEGFDEAMDFLKDEGAVAHSPTEEADPPSPDPEETEATQEDDAPDPEDSAEGEQQAEDDDPAEGDHDWQSRYSSLRTHSREQAEQLNQLKEQMEQQRQEFEERIQQENMQRQQQEQQAYAEYTQAQQQQAVASVSARDVDESVQQGDLLQTFQFVTQARPDLMPHFVNSVRQHHGDELAQQAVVAAQQVTTQQMQQSVEERMNDLETRMIAPQVIRSGLEDMVGSLAEQYGGEEGFAPVAEALLDRVQQMAADGITLPQDPNAVYNFLERNVLDIMRGQIIDAKNTPSGPQEVDTAALGESGRGGRAPQPSASDAEVDDLVAAFNDMRYGNHGPD